jgi:Chaperone of endosialidase
VSDQPTERPADVDPAPADPPVYEPPTVDDLPGEDPAATGGGFHTPVESDRNLKRGFADVDVDTVLAGVVDLPLTTWSYRADDPRVRHIGPMAQDFAAAFGVGEDDRHIHTVDANGVALAAIQALAARLAEAEAKIAELQAERAAV